LDDEIAPYDGGLIDGAGDLVFLNAVNTLEFWRGKNSCNGPLERENFGAEAWCDTDRNCQADVHTAMCTVYGGPRSGPYRHIIYSNTAELDLAELSWDFFQSFTLAANFQINVGLNDAWYNPATDGQGFLITVFPDRKEMFLAWFTFDTERPSDGVTAELGDPGHRWLTAQGPYDGDSATLRIFVTEGGVFDAAQPPATTDPAGDGTMTLEFADCTEGLVSYEITSLGISGEIPIQRIAPDNISLCETLGTQ
jgi:hypothetical protein